MLGIIVALSISGSVFQNMALRYLATALPKASTSELGQLVTGTSGTFYKGLGPDEKFLVVQQVTAAIRDSFYYLCGVTAIGFITSLFLSVSDAKPRTHPNHNVPGLTSDVLSQRRKLFLDNGVVPH